MKRVGVPSSGPKVLSALEREKFRIVLDVNERLPPFGSADERGDLKAYVVPNTTRVSGLSRKFRSHLNTVPWKLRDAQAYG
jgi:hypothetical protein